MAFELIFATRPSSLARRQTTSVIQELRHHWQDIDCQEVIITTPGDRNIDTALPEIGGKGLFTQELEAALLGGQVHAAVHSLKDLPTDEVPGLTIGALDVTLRGGAGVAATSAASREDGAQLGAAGESCDRGRHYSKTRDEIGLSLPDSRPRSVLPVHPDTGGGGALLVVLPL